MKGDSVCWREDWKALKPDMSCDTQRERERKRPIEFFYQVPLVHVKYLSACVHAHVCIPSACV